MRRRRSRRSEERRGGEEGRTRGAAYVLKRRGRNRRCGRDWSSDVCSSDLALFDAFAVDVPGRPHSTIHATEKVEEVGRASGGGRGENSGGGVCFKKKREE